MVELRGLEPLTPTLPVPFMRDSSEREISRFALVTCGYDTRCIPSFAVVSQPIVPWVCPGLSTVDKDPSHSRSGCAAQANAN